MKSNSDKSRKLKILLASWRDPYNPKKGGAEVAMEQILSRLVKKGHQVKWLGATFPGSKIKETVDGIKYVRMGKFYSVHGLAIDYIRANEKNFDIIIDELHGYPFFTKLYTRKPKLTMIHEVAGEIWFEMWGFPINWTGYLFEKMFYKLLGNHGFITPSQSTKEDLMDQGIKDINISVIKEGVNTKRLKSINYKTINNQICFVGRVCRMKGVSDLLRAFALVLKTDPKTKLVLMGRMDEGYKAEFDALLKELKIPSGNLKVTGFVSDEEREQYLKESKFLVSCSIKEGFGLIVLEANALGTPAITYYINAYKDIIENDVTGYLVEKKNIKQLAKKIRFALYKLPAKDYRAMQERVLEYSKQFDWDKCAISFEKILLDEIVKNDKRFKPNVFSRVFIKTMFGAIGLVGRTAEFFKLI